MASTSISSRRLRRELALRGWHASDLAQAAHISQGTISAALNGHPISVSTLRRMAVALVNARVTPGSDLLLDDEIA